jgi:hypothetical protein
MSKDIQEAVGGELARLLSGHDELVQGEREALAALKEAEQRIVDAEAADVAQEAARLRASSLGHDEPEDAPDGAKAAVAARDAAAQRVKAYGAALYQSLIAIDAEIRRTGEYAGKLEKREKAAMLAGLNGLKKVEASLAELRAARSARAWLADPATASGQLRPLPARELGSTITRPNGEPMAANTLTVGLREVFDPPATTQGDQRAEYGIPVGAVGPVSIGGQLVEPVPSWKTSVISSAAARVFAEQAAEVAA